MKHIFQDDSYQFNTSKNNYFELDDVDRNIWKFYQNNESTSFHVIGTPIEVFSNIDLNLLNCFSCFLVDIEIKILYAEGLRTLVCRETNSLHIKSGLYELATIYPLFKGMLDSCSAIVNEDEITKLIKANIL